MKDAFLIYKFLIGEATESEAALVQSRLAESQEFRTDYSHLEFLIDESRSGQNPSIQSWLRIQASIDQARVRRLRSARTRGLTLLLVVMSAIGALIIHGFLTQTVSESRNEFGRRISQNLTFENATVAEILDAVQRDTGGYTIFKEKPLLHCRFTGTFFRGASFQEIIQTLAEAKGLKWTMTEDALELSGHCGE